MKGLLYIRLMAQGQPVVYQNPLLEQVKKQLPDVAVLDVDSESGELVLHYARQLLQDATQTIIVIESATPDAAFGSVFTVIESLLDGQKDQLILFRQEHSRLLRMVQARPELKYKATPTDAELLQVITQFYSQASA